MAPDRFQSCRRHAPAIVTVRIAAELTRRDAPLEVGGEALGGLREDAVGRRFRRLRVDREQRVGQLQLRELRPEPPEIGDDA
jgi:hypothetical protein